jgi:hypothetical protein
MRTWKAVGLAGLLGIAGVAAWFVAPTADAGGIKNPFACARNPRCVDLYPSMKKIAAETKKPTPTEEIRNPFQECELHDPFKPDALCDQVRQARAEAAEAATRTVR